MVCCSLFLGEGRGVDNRLHYFSPCSTLPSGFLNLDAQGSVSVGNRGHAARMRRHIAPSVSCVDVAPPPIFSYTTHVGLARKLLVYWLRTSGSLVSCHVLEPRDEPRAGRRDVERASGANPRLLMSITSCPPVGWALRRAPTTSRFSRLAVPPFVLSNAAANQERPLCPASSPAEGGLPLQTHPTSTLASTDPPALPPLAKRN